MSIPKPIRDWLICEFLSDPCPIRFDFGDGESDSVVCVPFKQAAGMILKHGLDPLASLDRWKLDRLIADIRIDVLYSQDPACDPAIIRIIDRLELTPGEHRLVGIRHAILRSTPAPIAKPTAPTKKPASKGSSIDDKILAALNLHHRYQMDGAMNPDPIGLRELARKADVGDGSVSRFIKKHLGGHNRYCNLCRDESALLTRLKVLNNDFRPAELTQMIREGMARADEE